MSKEKIDKQSGQIKVVILTVVLAIVVGLVVWAIAKAITAQQDAERAAANIERQVKPKTAYVDLDIIGVRYKSSASAGQISYEVDENPSAERVGLVSSRLKLAKSECEGENSGRFGYIEKRSVNQSPTGSTAPSLGEGTYKKTIEQNTYVFVPDFDKKCYDAELAKQFSETVPKAIIDSLERIPEKKLQ